MDKTSLKKLDKSLLVDVETVNDQRIIMELSYNLLNDKLGIVEKKCYIIQQVWENEEYRQGKYAKEKLTHWQEMLDNGTAELISVYHLFNKLNKMIGTYKMKLFIAYNASFDKSAIKKTFHRYGCDKRGESLVDSMEIFDLWEYAKVHYKTLDFIKWALRNKKLTLKQKISTSAETLHSYICEQYGFIETHFGIEDLEIEYSILITSALANATNRNNNIELNKLGNWQTAEKVRKEMEEQGLL